MSRRRPGRRTVQVRPDARPGTAAAPVRAGHDGARDDLAYTRRLAGRTRSAGDGPDRCRSPPRALPPRANHPRRNRCAAADRDLHRRPGRGDGGLRAAVQLRDSRGSLERPGRGLRADGGPPTEGDLRLDVSGSIRLGTLGIRSYGRTTLAEGESAYVTLSWGASRVPASWEEATAALEATFLQT